VCFLSLKSHSNGFDNIDKKNKQIFAKWKKISHRRLFNVFEKSHLLIEIQTLWLLNYVYEIQYVKFFAPCISFFMTVTVLLRGRCVRVYINQNKKDSVE